MRVAIKGHSCARVPKKVLDQFGVDAAPKEQGSASVTEVVPADRREALSYEKRLEAALDYVLGIQGSALARGENEVRVLVIRRL
jgi:hypothetical protein